MYHDTYEDALNHEATLVTLNEVNNPMCYNMVVGGKHSVGYKHTNETKELMSTTKKNNMNEERVNNYRNSKLGDKNPQKGKIPWNKGLKASDELRKKLSDSHKGIKQTQETIQKRINAQTPEERSERQRRAANTKKLNKLKIK
jgi:multimeric flavodoxin WrbA